MAEEAKKGAGEARSTVTRAFRDKCLQSIIDLATEAGQKNLDKLKIRENKIWLECDRKSEYKRQMHTLYKKVAEVIYKHFEAKYASRTCDWRTLTPAISKGSRFWATIEMKQYASSEESSDEEEEEQKQPADRVERSNSLPQATPRPNSDVGPSRSNSLPTANTNSRPSRPVSFFDAFDGLIPGIPKKPVPTQPKNGATPGPSPFSASSRSSNSSSDSSNSSPVPGPSNTNPISDHTYSNPVPGPSSSAPAKSNSNPVTAPSRSYFMKPLTLDPDSNSKSSKPRCHALLSTCPGSKSQTTKKPTIGLGPSNHVDGPSQADPRPSQTEPGPSQTEPRLLRTDPGPGPSRIDPGPAGTDPGPSRSDTKPSQTEPRPSKTDYGPLRAVPGPSRPDPGPSRPDPGPSRSDPGPSQPDTTPGPSYRTSAAETLLRYLEDDDRLPQNPWTRNNSFSVATVNSTPDGTITLTDDDMDDEPAPVRQKISIVEKRGKLTLCNSIYMDFEIEDGEGWEMPPTCQCKPMPYDVLGKTNLPPPLMVKMMEVSDKPVKEIVEMLKLYGDADISSGCKTRLLLQLKQILIEQANLDNNNQRQPRNGEPTPSTSSAASTPQAPPANSAPRAPAAPPAINMPQAFPAPPTNNAPRAPPADDFYGAIVVTRPNQPSTSTALPRTGVRDLFLRIERSRQRQNKDPRAKKRRLAYDDDDSNDSDDYDDNNDEEEDSSDDGYSESTRTRQMSFIEIERRREQQRPPVQQRPPPAVNPPPVFALQNQQRVYLENNQNQLRLFDAVNQPPRAANPPPARHFFADMLGQMPGMNEPERLRQQRWQDREIETERMIREEEQRLIREDERRLADQLADFARNEDFGMVRNNAAAVAHQWRNPQARVQQEPYLVNMHGHCQFGYHPPVPYPPGPFVPRVITHQPRGPAQPPAAPRPIQTPQTAIRKKIQTTTVSSNVLTAARLPPTTAASAPKAPPAVAPAPAPPVARALSSDAEPTAGPSKEKDDSGLDCCICLDERRQVAFVPCGHMVCCIKCADSVEECPVCRKKIERRMQVFLT